jgi:hypothetical protein
MQAHWLRRALPVVLAGTYLVAACTEAPSPTKPSTLGATAAESWLQGAAGAHTLPGQGDAQSALAAVRRATAAFHDVDQAVAAGYLTPVGGHCEASGDGTMGVHSTNIALALDPAIDPNRPEILLYLPTGDGQYRLVGVEYLQILLLRNMDTGAVGPWFSPDPWPANYVIVNPAPSVFGHTFDGPMPGHNPSMPWHYDLHVWAWAPNPSGTFSMWNPSISCR